MGKEPFLKARDDSAMVVSEIIIIDYRDNDLGDYDEVAIIFFVTPAGGSPEEAGTFIYKLPVNQSFTCEAGCTIWGFPKTVEKIDLSAHETHVTCRVEMDGEHLLTLSIPRGLQEPGSPAADETVGPTYTYIDGVPHRTEGPDEPCLSPLPFRVPSSDPGL